MHRLRVRPPGRDRPGGRHLERAFRHDPASLRAALHAGPVVTAEVGVDRHKIAYFWADTVNATGRLEALCRELSLPVLISADLLDQVLALPPGVVAERLGEKTVRGRDRALAVAVLHRREDRATGPSRTRPSRVHPPRRGGAALIARATAVRSGIRAVALSCGNDAP